MVVSEGEVERIAREMIRQHGPAAARAAVDRLNELIDRGDWRGRDVWARIVHAIHDVQHGVGEVAIRRRMRQETDRPTAQ